MNARVPVQFQRTMNVMIGRNNRYYRADGIGCADARGLSPGRLRYRGVALIWSAILMMLMILLIGLSLDTAKVALVLHQMQNGADAAALAGTRIVKIDPNGARLLAQSVAQQNFADLNPVLLDLNMSNDPNGDIVIGRYDRLNQVFTPVMPGTGSINAMAVMTVRSHARVELGGPVSLNFGPIAGVDAIDLVGRWQTKRRAYAIAMTAGGTGAGLICIRDDGVGLKVQASDSHLTVNNLTGNYNDGAIQVNSTGDAGMSIISTPVIEAWEINMCASTHSETTDFTFPDVNLVNYLMPRIPDPLLGLPAPTWDPLNDLSPSPGETIVVSEGETRTFSPGYYSGGFRFSGGTSILQPGIYILDGRSTGQKAGLVTTGGANIDATAGVMFYITGDGVINIGGNGVVRADPMTEGVYEHVTIFVDRDSDNSSIIHGTTGLDLNGTLYFPQVPSPTDGPNQAFSLEIDGTGEGFGNQLIADSIYIPGQADVVINYDGRNPAPVTRAFLVE